MRLSGEVATKEIESEKVYYTQLRTNSQVTIPKQCVEDLGLQRGDIIGLVVLKLLDTEDTWSVVKKRAKIPVKVSGS